MGNVIIPKIFAQKPLANDKKFVVLRFFVVKKENFTQSSAENAERLTCRSHSGLLFVLCCYMMLPIPFHDGKR